MPVIVIQNAKGGTGKSTAALVLAQTLSNMGASVSLIDADPNRPQHEWARLGRVPENLRVLPEEGAEEISEDTIMDVIEDAAARDQFVIVDLEGTANLTHSYSLSQADLVIIPMQGKYLDAMNANKAIRQIKREEKVRGRAIPHTVLVTRTNPAIRPRSFRYIEERLEENGIPYLPVHLTERDAFSALFQLGGTLYDLKSSDANNPAAAIENARALTEAVIAELRKGDIAA